LKSALIEPYHSCMARGAFLLLAATLVGASVAGCDNGGLLLVQSVQVDAGGPNVNDIVNGGTVATSPKYKVVYTFGQSSPGQNVSTSPNNRDNGGLVGAMNGP
jgi:hypothetical protein